MKFLISFLFEFSKELVKVIKAKYTIKIKKTTTIPLKRGVFLRNKPNI
jgi:hypothetical protein